MMMFSLLRISTWYLKLHTMWKPLKEWPWQIFQHQSGKRWTQRFSKGHWGTLEDTQKLMQIHCCETPVIVNLPLEKFVSAEINWAHFFKSTTFQPKNSLSLICYTCFCSALLTGQILYFFKSTFLCTLILFKALDKYIWRSLPFSYSLISAC